MARRKRDSASAPPRSLRNRARERLQTTRTDVAKMTPENVQSLVEDLQLHQAELEIQNEELREAQQALVAMRDRYHALYEFAPVGYVTLDMEGRVIEANLAASAMLGPKRNQLMRRRFTDFLAPESQDTFYLAWHRNKDNGQAHATTCELVLHERAGARTVVQVQCEQLIGDHGEGAEMFCALVDVTARKHAEQAVERLNVELERRVEARSATLRQREEELGTILDTAPEGILTVGQEGVVLKANRAAQRLFAESEAGLSGRSVTELLPGVEQWLRRQHGAERDGDAVQAFQRGGRLEVVATAADGSTFPARLSLARVPAHDFFVVIVMDMSESRKLEREVLDAAEEERRRISRELHDSVGQSLAGLAMMVRSREKRLAALGEEVYQALAETRIGLEGAVRDTRAVIHDLAPAGLDEGGLAHALERVAERLREQSDIDCTCECIGSEPPIDVGAKLQLLRIATEAAHNALKHGAASHIALRLESGPTRVSLAVSDDGRGIGAVPEGMGIGIMRHRAQVIGGRLNVARRTPRGTIVVATVPL